MASSTRVVSRRQFLKIGGAGLAGAALLGVAGCGGGGGGGAGGEQSYNFRLAETHPEDYPTTRADKRFAKLVGERSDGRINIEVFPGSQLGEEASAIEQVQTGSLELTRVSTSPMAEFTPSLEVFSLPYIFDSSEHMWSFLQSEDGQSLLDQLSDSGFKGLAYYDSGARSFYTANREVTTPEDLQGLKIRVQQSEINSALMEAFGASATPMDFGEVYSALQTGVVDGAENNWPSYLSTSHYEVAPNYTLDEHTRIPEIIVMNQGTWDELSDEDKQIIQDAATESVEYQREQWDQEVQKAKDKLASEGVNVIPVEDKEPWREAAQPVIESNQEKFGDVLDQIEAAKP